MVYALNCITEETTNTYFHFFSSFFFHLNMYVNVFFFSYRTGIGRHNKQKKRLQIYDLTKRPLFFFTLFYFFFCFFRPQLSQAGIKIWFKTFLLLSLLCSSGYLSTNVCHSLFETKSAISMKRKKM